MATKYKPLTIYRIRETVDGVLVQNFEDIIVEPDPAEPERVTAYDLTSPQDFEARLYVAKPNIKRPPWQEFLEDGFGDLDGALAEAVSNSAVLLVKVKWQEAGGERDLFFAFTFGFGRYLLRRNSYKPNYGLRVALNAIYKSGSAPASRVRSVDAKTVAANTLHTRRQADRWANFETFEIDAQRDFLRAITGQPVEIAHWGTRVSGSAALNVNCPVAFAELGELCRRIEGLSRQDDYRDRFSWVDNVRAVVNPELRASLEEHLLEKLKDQDVVDLELAPPELIDWDQIAHFRFSIASDEERDDLRLEDYLTLLADKSRLSRLTISQLQKRHKLEVVDAGDEVIHQWAIWACLTGELEFEGQTYLFNGGDFFEVAKTYLDALNRYVSRLPESPKPLPDSLGDMKEGPYNELAADSSPDYLLLDKQTVRVASRTSPIEICDVFTTAGEFIHVKRKLGSSSLSHLFGQGSVSADLFLMSREYRQKTLEKIQEAEAARVAATGDPGFAGRFSTFDPAGITPGDYEVVYAVVAKWDGREFVEALPFFSKVNLRKHCNDLRRMGYRVSYKRVPVA